MSPAGTPDRPADGQQQPRPDDAPLKVGDVLHGFCGGAFGRDHYDCSHIEALGPDWVVVRSSSEYPLIGFAVGPPDRLTQYRQENDYCPSHPCPTQPVATPAAPGSCGHHSDDGHTCDVASGHLGYHRNIRNGGEEWTTWVGDYPDLDEEQQP